MKIGFVIYGSLDTVSGGYLYDRKLVEYLRAQGDMVEIISLPWRNYAAHLMDNIRFRIWNPEASFWIGQQAVRLQSLDVLVQDELNHPSLIGANSGTHPYPIVSLVHHLRCSELRPKWQNDLYRIVEKKYLQSVDGFIFNSKTTKGVVNGLADHEKPSVIAYPPTDRFGKAVSENEIMERAKDNELRILFLGNVIYRKGLHTLLRAISNQRLAVRVDIIGGLSAEPKYAEEMQRLVTVNGLASRVTFHGALDNEPLVEMYKHSHIMVVPSSYEGFGIVYLEGMGFGLPAIGTTAGAAGEIITHSEDGYLIKPDDAKALAEHITELAGNRELLAGLSLNAVKRYRMQPKWDETAKSIREFLYAIASKQ
jgi:glycosyltransferase involved in cell wall biosynthesis